VEGRSDRMRSAPGGLGWRGEEAAKVSSSSLSKWSLTPAGYPA